jgi:threonyl-tRNA synthetase
MTEIAIIVEGQPRKVEVDQKPTHIFADNKEIVVCKINGVLRDLWTDLAEGDVVEGVSISSSWPRPFSKSSLKLASVLVRQ